MKQKIIPIGMKVLVKKKKSDDFFPGTKIIIPETAKDEEYKAFVIAVGDEVTNIKIGDLVQYADYCVPTKMKHEGEDHLLINVGDIFAVIVNE